jgi:hypothetical protein
MGSQGAPCFPKISPARRARYDAPVGRLRLPKQKNEQGGYYPRVWTPVMRAGQNELDPHYYVDHTGERRYNAIPYTGGGPWASMAAVSGKLFFPPSPRKGLTWHPENNHTRRLFSKQAKSRAGQRSRALQQPGMRMKTQGCA